MKRLLLTVFVLGSMGVTQAAERERPAWAYEDPEPEEKRAFFESYSEEEGYRSAGEVEAERIEAERRQAELEREEEKKPFLGFPSASKSTVASRERPWTPRGVVEKKKPRRKRRSKRRRREEEISSEQIRLEWKKTHAQELEEAAAYEAEVDAYEAWREVENERFAQWQKEAQEQLRRGEPVTKWRPSTYPG